MSRIDAPMVEMTTRTIELWHPIIVEGPDPCSRFSRGWRKMVIYVRDPSDRCDVDAAVRSLDNQMVYGSKLLRIFFRDHGSTIPVELFRDGYAVSRSKVHYWDRALALDLPHPPLALNMCEPTSQEKD